MRQSGRAKLLLSRLTSVNLFLYSRGMKITANADGTFSWQTKEGCTITSCVLPYAEKFYDRYLIGYVLLSYSLWARTFLREFWVAYVSASTPRWMQQAKRQPLTLADIEHSRRTS